MAPGEIWRRVASFFHRQRFETDLEEELRFHLEMKTDAYRDEGATADDARFAAMRRVGNTATLKERSREVWGWGWFEALVQVLSIPGLWVCWRLHGSRSRGPAGELARARLGVRHGHPGL